jgi:hypothetical protein
MGRTIIYQSLSVACQWSMPKHLIPVSIFRSLVRRIPFDADMPCQQINKQRCCAYPFMREKSSLPSLMVRRRQRRRSVPRTKYWPFETDTWSDHRSRQISAPYRRPRNRSTKQALPLSSNCDSQNSSCAWDLLRTLGDLMPPTRK